MERSPRDAPFKSPCQGRGLQCSALLSQDWRWGRERSPEPVLSWVCPLCRDTAVAQLWWFRSQGASTGPALPWMQQEHIQLWAWAGTDISHSCPCLSSRGTFRSQQGQEYLSLENGVFVVERTQLNSYQEPHRIIWNTKISVCLNSWATPQFYTKTSRFFFFTVFLIFTFFLI